MADYTSSYTGEQIDAGIAKANTALQPNTAITAATKCKVTYDSKGLVTGGADLSASDIPSHDTSKLTSGTLGVARGGTGASTLASGAVLIGNGAGAVQTRAITNNTSAASVSGTNIPTCNTVNYAINARVNRSTNVNAADTNYTTLMARGESLNSTETTPAVNGAIAWTYA